MYIRIHNLFQFLNKYGLPVKYAFIGFCGGVIWLIIAYLMDYPMVGGIIGTLLSVTFGGLVGGFIRQKVGKSN
jgi:hypothetical protein